MKLLNSTKLLNMHVKENKQLIIYMKIKIKKKNHTQFVTKYEQIALGT